jgi:hypothetical protein
VRGRKRVRATVVGFVGATVLGIAGVSVATTVDDPDPESTSETETVPIECGGYNGAGEVVNAEAAAVNSAPLDETGLPIIPAVCAGYTADGVFIGDD